MTADPRLLSAFLRQVAELGGPDLYLEDRTGEELRDLVAGRHDPAARAGRRTTAGTRPASGTGAQAGIGAPRIRVAPAPVPAKVEPARLRTLETLQQTASGCTLCRLHESRTQVVFGEGHPNADVAVVGEAPGRDEDRTGRPFVGRAGKLLDLLLMTAGFPRENVYICNVLKCRPPENRNPKPDEMEMCTSHYLHAQLAAVAPRVILTVGRFAVQSLLATDAAIGRLRGRIHTYRETPAIVSYHPAYLLRSPNMVVTAWEDLQLLRSVLDEQD
jgi:DNA polymerase